MTVTVHYFIKLPCIKMSAKKQRKKCYQSDNIKAFCYPHSVQDNDFRETVLLCTKYFFV